MKQMLHKPLALLSGLLFCLLLNAQTIHRSDTFYYSGQIVRWAVPQGVTSLTITAKGAEGSGGNNGWGAVIKGNFVVSPGAVLKILVGQKPTRNEFPSGGGGSFVTDTSNNPLLIAGGGGGGGGGNIDAASKHGQAGQIGGRGAGADGGAGGTVGNGGGPSFNSSGGGGLLTNGGGVDGGKAFINGGAGGGGNTNAPAGFGGGGSFGLGGGGGGGYSGGGGGSRYAVGGGGGSFNGGTAQENVGGANTGNGLVVIDYDVPFTPSLTCTPDTAVSNDAGQCGAVVNYNVPSFSQGTYNKPISDTFYYSGAPQTFVMPTDVSSVKIQAWGAQGGISVTNGSCGENGGLGGYSQGTLAVQAGQLLFIYVGGHPGVAGGDGSFAGGFNGGGTHGKYGGGGGGASDVRTGSSSLSDRIIVAGGGGGAGSNPNNYDNPCIAGGSGGGLSGTAGMPSDYIQAQPGGEGTQTEGGAAGYNGETGSLGQGGNNQGLGLGRFYAGGGGGYYGGGSARFAGAGGGSAYIGGVTDGNTQTGVNLGDGLVIITYQMPFTPALVQTAGQPSGSLFPAGVTVNRFALVAVHDTLATCSFNVTVKDTTKPTITAPAAITVGTDAGKCSANAVALGTPLTADNCTVQSVTNNAPAVFSKGNTTVIWTVTDAVGNQATATQTVTVTDNEKPIVTSPAAQKFCYVSTGSYTIPSLTASDNCGVQSITYSISGATTRSGTGTVASGSFASGTSTITWTVKDAAGNQSTGQTTVTVNPQILVSIPDVKVLPKGVDANTVYAGYAPASSITLTAQAAGGSGTYTYKWSTGATTQSIKVSPGSTTTYTVTVTDAKGCSSTAIKQVKVVNVSCSGNKVNVCHGGNSLCIDKGSVPDHLNHGDKLGSCGANSAVTYSSKVSNAVEETMSATEPLRVYPNPSKGPFTAQLFNVKAAKATVLVLDAQGAVAEQRSIQLTAGIQTLRFNLGNKASGLYLIKVISAAGVQATKVVVQK